MAPIMGKLAKTEEFRCQVYEKPQFKMHLYHALSSTGIPSAGAGRRNHDHP